jgi:hypothetical protein
VGESAVLHDENAANCFRVFTLKNEKKPIPRFLFSFFGVGGGCKMHIQFFQWHDMFDMLDCRAIHSIGDEDNTS